MTLTHALILWRLLQVNARDDLVIDPEFLRRFDRPGPRYTSYPTADRFVEAFGSDQYRVALSNRAVGGITRPLSLYVHLPFCNTICYYCGCNKIITKDHGRSAKYLKYLARETRLVTDVIGRSRPLAQLHLGGGTPTFLSRSELTTLVDSIGEHFRLVQDGEYSIEVDPRSCNPETVATLANLGFNRLSVGVQDVNPEVQRAVNRIQPAEQTAAVVDAARASGFKSINIDLIYGLPKQTLASFDTTLHEILRFAPDRIALYNYAHLPSLFKPQRRINEADLPSAEERFEILAQSIRMLTFAGYVYIGMDHFARPDDELAVAQRQGRLHRNFQGYSTRAECDLVALGISAISGLPTAYSQNVKTLDEYYDRLDRGIFPVMRGIELTADDLVRRAVIQAFMCHSQVSISAIEIAYLIEFERYFAEELAELREYEALGLVTLEGDWISVTPRGRLVVRVIAMLFDRYLRTSRERARYSKVI